jgi:OOP family OmpA-OmpF porin
MPKLLILLLFFCLPVLSSAQDTLNFDLMQFNGRGSFKNIKSKSSLTGMVSYRRIPTGLWQYYDNKQVLRVKGKYKVKNGIAIPTGVWEFYDTIGDMVMISNRGPKKKSTTYLRPFVIITTHGLDVIKENSKGELELFHYIKPKSYQQNQNHLALTDSVINQEYDTLEAMDSRNPNTNFLAKQPITSVAEDLNLINNYSFEDNERGQTNFTNIGHDVTNWWSSAGSPDYYYGNAYHAAEGKASIGCRFYTHRSNHIEFISTELKKPLETGKKYCFKTLLKLKEDCYFGVNAVGVLLSNYLPGENELIEGKIKPSISHHQGTPLTYKTQWMELSCAYTAAGGESILTLGSFSNAKAMKKVGLKGSNFESYYYFDMVQLYEIEDETQCPCLMGKNNDIPIEKGKAFVVKNIFFNNDQWELLPSSFVALDSLFELLQSGQFKQIEISGHTSNTGSKERNILLSKNRALAVKNYLVNKGLQESTFTCIGYGPDKPISDNSTEKGRSENRRVEFKILE